MGWLRAGAVSVEPARSVLWECVVVMETASSRPLAWHLHGRRGEQLLHGGGDGGDVPAVGKMPGAVLGYEADGRQRGGEGFAAGERDDPVAAIVQHERRCPHLGNQLGDVGLVD